MKTAVSLDDSLLLEADKSARQIGVSRSRFFAMALAEFLKRQKQEQMLRQLNEVYAEPMTTADKRLLKGMKARLRRIADHQ